MDAIDGEHQNGIALHEATILQLHADRCQIVVASEDIAAAVVELLACAPGPCTSSPKPGQT